MFFGDGAHRIVLNRKHGRTLVALQRFRDLHLRPCAFFAVAGYAPAVSPLRAPHIFCQWSENLISDRPSRLLDLNDKKLLAYLDTNFPPASTMETVDTAAKKSFLG